MAHVSSRYRSAHSQRGIATLLITLMIGLSLSAAVLHTAYQLRSAQAHSVSVHAQTQAQAHAWSAAEVAREYFDALSQSGEEWHNFYAQLETALQNGKPVPLHLGMNDIKANIVRVAYAQVKTDQAPSPVITVLVTATAADKSKAHTTSTLELQYAGVEPKSGIVAPNNSTINFHGGLRMTGGIDVLKDLGDTKQYEINVIGDVIIGGTSITGVDIIRSTGSIQFNGGTSFFRELRANCDIALSSGAAAELLHATNNICASNTTYPSGKSNSEVRANGSIHINGSSYGNLFALAGKGNFQQCANNAERFCNPPTQGVRLDGTPRINEIHSKAHIDIRNSANVTRMNAEGNIQVTWGFTLQETARYGGQYTAPGDIIPASKRQYIPGLNVDISPAQPVSIRTEVFNVNDLRPVANYIFYEDENRNLRVSVRHLRNVRDGNYYLFHGTINNRPYNDWICTSATPRAEDCLAKIGLGHSEYNRLFSYDRANQRWKLDGTSMAPGVVLFEGNLTVSSGTYYNTVMATGNIDTAGNLNMYAPNFAGYDGLLNQTRYAPEGICSNRIFPSIVPTQLCSETAYLYNAINGLGNFALLAGSCADADCDPYVGGDIKTGASNNIRGAIKAGNIFVSQGDTRVHGYITALAQRDITRHTMSAKTTIDLRNLPPGYDPTGSATSPGDGSGGTEGKMAIWWSRYL